MCIALDLCEQHGIAHRDLKPENIILDESNKRYLISDFGEAIQLPNFEKEIEIKYVGTPAYMSKEVFDCKGKD